MLIWITSDLSNIVQCRGLTNSWFSILRTVCNSRYAIVFQFRFHSTLALIRIWIIWTILVEVEWSFSWNWIKIRHKCMACTRVEFNFLRFSTNLTFSSVGLRKMTTWYFQHEIHETNEIHALPFAVMSGQLLSVRSLSWEWYIFILDLTKGIHLKSRSAPKKKIRHAS